MRSETLRRFLLAGSIFLLSDLGLSDDGIAAVDEARACRRNLALIYEAIQARGIEVSELLPTKLSGILGPYLADGGVLQCPTARRKGRYGANVGGIRDMTNQDSKQRGYKWEFNHEEQPLRLYPKERGKMEWLDFKNFQAQTPVKPHVPIVRCDQHVHETEHWLNLPFDGAIYESGYYWEANWRAIFSGSYLAPDLVRLDQRSIAQRLPPRPIQAGPDQIDLTAHYNALLGDDWLFATPDGPCSLAALERTLDRGWGLIGGTGFDVRGVIQLDCRLFPNPWSEEDRKKGIPNHVFPSEVGGIGIGRPCKRVHFLCGCAFAAPRDQVVGHVDIRYAGGVVESLALRYGVEVENWWHKEGAPPPGGTASRVAWTGEAEDTASSGDLLRLHLVTWTNPRPADTIASLTLHSGMTSAAPFFLAITLE